MFNIYIYIYYVCCIYIIYIYIYIGKIGTSNEGCACFINKNKFKYIYKFNLYLNKILRNCHELQNLFNLYPEISDILYNKLGNKYIYIL